MIKFENTETHGWEAAIRGMRNPMNSWARSDSSFDTDVPYIGYNDWKLIDRLKVGGPVHAKFRRMITVYVDITAPLYWWKEFDTYKVGTVANSCSTMHTIHKKMLTVDDFSHEHLTESNMTLLRGIICTLNENRYCFNEKMSDNPEDDWWQLIQLLPSSYNQKRTIMLNYEVLSNIYIYRKNHKLDEWKDFCSWIETLPYSKIIFTKSETKEM